MPQNQPVVQPIRVALSNDYEIALLGLAQMLAGHPSEVQIVDLTTQVAMPHDPDIILFDSFGRLPDNDVKLRKVVEANPRAKVVVYSGEDYPDEAARRHGAVGYLHKSLSAGDLVAAIVAIHHGESPRPPEDDEQPLVTWPGKEHGLSQRESEVLTFITRGVSNKEISERASFGINSVKSYIRSAYRKIGVDSRTQAVIWAYAHGFQSTDDTGL